jgi:hypothetical protein
MARKRKNKYEKMSTDDLFMNFQLLYEKWEQFGSVHHELEAYAEQVNITLLCFDENQKAWIRDTFLDYSRGGYERASEIGRLIEGCWELFDTWGHRATKGVHPLYKTPMVPDPNDDPGPWFKDWAEHNPRHWWALCRLGTDTERLRMQQRILDCGSLTKRDMMALWNAATKMEEIKREAGKP